VAREKFEARIERGRQSGAAIIEKVQNEVPVDLIVKGRVLKFDGDIDDRTPGSPGGVLLGVADEPGVMTTHKWALQQVCSRGDMPWKYAQKLMEKEREGWGTPLVAYNLNEIYQRSKSKYLLRTHGSQLRGFLSDRYKRLDSRPLLDAFAGACGEMGAIPINGFGTDTKVGLTAVLPKIYEPVPNEPISFGVHWENSDYGNGRHMVYGFIDRAWCANGCFMSTEFAQVHLGKKISESIFLSERTHQLDTMAAASAVVDTVKGTLGEEMIQTFCQTVADAHEMKIDPAKAVKQLAKQLNKGESEMVLEKFNSPDVEMLPAGNTAWRLSNAISWVAGNEVSDAERSMELMKIAGAVLTMRNLARAQQR
jgi:hypothetical protein